MDSQINDHSLLLRREAVRKARSIGTTFGPYLEFNSLTELQKEVLASCFLKEIQWRNYSELTREFQLQIYSQILGEFGIMCPHHFDQRIYNKSLKWFNCKSCNAAVINNEKETEEISIEFTDD